MSTFLDGDDVFTTSASSASTAAFDGSGTDRAIFGFVGASAGGGSPTINSATWNGGGGNSLTSLAAQLSFHTYLAARGFALVGIDSDASDTVTGVCSTTVDELYVYGASATGVGSIGNVDSHVDTASPGSWQPTGVGISDLVMFGVYGGYGGFDPAFTAGTLVVEDISNVYVGGAGAYIQGSVGDTISLTWDPTADDVGGIAVNFVNVSAGDTINASITQSFTFSESQSAAAQLNAFLSETLTFNDQIASTVNLLVTLNENILFNDLLTGLIVIQCATTEGLAFTAQHSILRSVLAAIQESIVFNEIVNNSAVLNSIISESIVFSSIENTGNLIAAAIQESLTFSDDQTLVLFVNASISESLIFNENISIQAEIAAALQEGIAFNDALIAQSTLLAAIVESFTLSDAQVAAIVGEITSIEGRDLVIIQAHDTVIKIKWKGKHLVIIQDDDLIAGINS